MSDNKPLNIIILGGGKIGGYAAYRLLTQSKEPYKECTVTVVDGNENCYANDLYRNGYNRIATNRFKFIKISLDNWLEFSEQITEDYDYVINAVPIYNLDFVNSVLVKCMVEDVNYLDFSEDEQMLNHIKTITKVNLKPFVAPACGLAPGIIGILAGDMVRKHDNYRVINNLKMYVGTLTNETTNHILYHPTWSVDGILNEYEKPCTILKDELLQQAPALSGKETLIIDGIQYEAFRTSGGATELIKTVDRWNKDSENGVVVRNAEYRSIRYPGHLDRWAAVPDHARKIVLQKSTAFAGVEDVVHILISAEFDNNMGTDILSKTVYGDSSFSAIQKTTVSGLLMVLDAHVQGNIKKHGLLDQSSEIEYDMISNSVFNYIR